LCEKLHKHFTNIIREVFPKADIFDSALVHPITKNGWDVNVPQISDCNFSDPDYRLIINLQDMLTYYPGLEFPSELIKLHQYFTINNAPVEQIIVIIWPQGIKHRWPKDRFNLIEFSSHQYETWCSYKDAEDVLREAFSSEHKDFEYNFVCPQRIYKPHRAILESLLSKSVGNVSLQTKGIELKYPNLSVEEYDETYNNCMNLLAMRKNYNTSLFTIVSESQYSEPYGIITEKTFNAIVAGHPFLIAAHQWALEHIQNLGFNTWAHIFDETYDDLDNVVRIKDMVESNHRFTCDKLSAIEMQAYYDMWRPAIEYNRDYFFNQLGDRLISELRLDLLNLWRA